MTSMPSPESPSDRASHVVEFLEPSATKKWRSLPSWEQYIENISTVEKTKDNELFILFKLKGEKTVCKEKTCVCADKFPKKLLQFYESNLRMQQA